MGLRFSANAAMPATTQAGEQVQGRARGTTRTFFLVVRGERHVEQPALGAQALGQVLLERCTSGRISNTTIAERGRTTHRR